MSAPTLELASGHSANDAHSTAAAGTPSSRPAMIATRPMHPAPDGNQTTREGHPPNGPHVPSALAGQVSRPTTDGMSPKDSSSGGTPNFSRGHATSDLQESFAAGDQTEDGSAATIVEAPPKSGSSLADPLLALLADVREDAQRNRIANENRLRHLTRIEADEDGEVRGLGLDERHPDVARLAALVQMLADVEHQATLNLNRRMRQHPLGPWLKEQRGVGHGTLPARLIAILGDPYVNMQAGEIRKVSQLWSYCGHGDASRKRRKGMSQADLFAMGNPDAKMIVHLIAESCMKAGGPYREVYDARKAATEGREHSAECVRCGPSGKPALPGSPWSNAHRHADALRITGKAILRDLWLEAKRIHEEGAA